MKYGNFNILANKNVKCENKKEDSFVKSPPRLMSRLLYIWTFPLLYYGNRRDLEDEDLVPVKTSYCSKFVGDDLERNWLQEEARAKAAHRQASFVDVLFKTFIWSFIPGGVMQFLFIGLRTVSPLLFARLLDFWSVSSTMTTETAVYFATGLVLSNLTAAFFNHQGNFYCQQYGMKLRLATSTLIFRKIMRMNNAGLDETTAGKVVNLLSNDLQRFDLAFLFLHYIWIIPIQLVAICYLGFIQAGYAALIGLAVFITIALPIQGILEQLLGKVRFRTAEKNDDRVMVMSEVIYGLQDNGVQVYPLQQFISAAQINITLILPLVLSFTFELFASLRRVQEFLVLVEEPDLTETTATPLSNLFRNVKGTFKTSKKSSIRPLSNHTTPNLPSGISTLNGYVSDMNDTLCKHKLDESRQYTYDVASIWSDSEVAKALEIMTNNNTPATLADSSLCPTLCTARSEKRKLIDHNERVIQLFSQLIARQIQNEQLLKKLQQANAALTTASYTDELTGLPNRRAVFDQLPRLFSSAADDDRYVLVAFADLDGFKQINDVYGHETGDDFLCAIGSRLKEGVRGDDVLGRVGGDEFVVAGIGPRRYAEAQRAAMAFRARLAGLLSGEYRLKSCVIDYTGPSIGVIAINPMHTTPDGALREADTLMYADKKRRKNCATVS